MENKEIKLKTLIIDSNYLCNVCKYSIRDLSYENQETGIIYGFIAKIISLMDIYKTGRIIFVWDTKSTKRKQIYPEYKANRQKGKSEEEIQFDKLCYSQFRELRTYVLPELGFINNFWQDGYEGDDLIASIVEKTPDDYVVFSNDGDLYQLLDYCTMLNSKKLEFSKADFINEWRINPKEWIQAKQISGCKTDNVAGIVGVAEKTAIKYMRGELKHTSKKYQSIINGEDIIKRNKILVELPFPGTNTFDIVFSKLDVLNFIRVCNQFGFRSFIESDRMDKWKKYLC